MSLAHAEEAHATSGHTDLGHEGFMSVAELQDYMRQMEVARMSEALHAMELAERARRELIIRLAQPRPLTENEAHAIMAELAEKVHHAADRGATEVLVMRFPNVLCTDHGRAINNGEDDWPKTLTGRPRQCYELWRDHLHPAGYHLKALIIEWPGGLPGDVGLFLSWSAPDPLRG